MTDNLTLAVNHALDQAMARSRMAMASAYGVAGAIDDKRPQAWCEYGFPKTVDFGQLMSLYRRGGLAFGAVKKITDKCWSTDPEVIEGEGKRDRTKNTTKWEKTVSEIFNNALWYNFFESDKRRLVGRYSGLLLQINDSNGWDQPVVGSKSKLVKVIPAWACSLQPGELETDTKSENYGKPKEWTYREVLPGGHVSDRKIHPDRVFILGDYASDAIGFLEPAYNNFVSIEKVEGGSGESFLKNASRQLNVNFDKEVDLAGIAAIYGVGLDELQVKFNDAARQVNRGNDLMLITQGATTTPLVSAVPDPTPTYNINLQTISAALDIPTKVLVGMQTGERASSEDQKYFNARCQARRVRELTREINDFVAHLMRIKLIDTKAKFTAIWDDLTVPAKAEMLANSKTLAEINEKSLGGGAEYFSASEIRETAGYEPDELPEPLPDNDPEDDDAKSADPTGKSS
ncbi:anti-CBASS Acb1 family protein [Ectopseudomonas mendocina]|uniref:Anti-CBASS Acb1 family protein n=1 Tax=Ectopseudomonas mendocina TaxID=300 RepID=A0ABZ2RA84_ECTME